VNPNEIIEVMERRGAVLRGHFVLSSGRHSDLFVQKFRVLEEPRLAQRFGESIAAQFDNDFDVVASPAVGAVVLGFAAALASETRFVFAERSGEDLEFRRGFHIDPHEKVLVVEDVITTGGSAKEVVDLVKKAGGDVVGVGALIDRGDPVRPPDLGTTLKALIRLDVESWAPEECPLCAADEAIVDPGSRRLR
jgi:orotate phosphoribosyltransferase